MKSNAKRNCHIGIWLALVCTLALVVALPVFASASTVNEVADLDANDIPASADPVEGVETDPAEGEGAPASVDPAEGEGTDPLEGNEANLVKKDEGPVEEGDVTMEDLDGVELLGVEMVSFDANDGSNVNNISQGGFISITNSSKLAVSSTGVAVAPQFYVEWRGTQLVEGTDYEFDEYGYRDGDGYHSLGSVLPNRAGSFILTVRGIGSFTGETQTSFTVYENANDLGLAQVVKCDPDWYAWTGKAVTPAITVTFDGVSLTQGVDFEIDAIEYQNQGPSVRVEQAIDQGNYIVTLKGKGDKYSGTATALFSIVDSKNLEYATVADASGEKAPTYAWNNGEPVVPNVVVTAADGTVLKQGADYTLVYEYVKGNDYNPQGTVNIPQGEFAEVTQEGAYWAIAKAVDGSGYTGKTTRSRLTFYVSKPAHDLREAAIDAPEILEYTGGSLKDTLRKNTSVAFEGQKPLELDKEYNLGFEVGNRGLDLSGVPGKHKMTVIGSASALATGTYYGTVTHTYFVSTDEAPLPDTRQDETGVIVVGSIIDQLSTYKGDNWVSLTVAQPTGDAVEREAQAAQVADAAAGKQTVAVFDIKLALTKEGEGGSASSENLANNLGNLALSFPVGEKYNGMTATITQIHDGAKMASKTVTVENGVVSTDTDRLSQFVISIDPKPAADEKDAEDTTDAANTKATKAEKAEKAGALAKTGDALPIQFVLATAAIAAAVLCALVSGRRISLR